MFTHDSPTKTIMLVEDDIVTQSLLRRQLTNAGYEVLSADSVERATALVKRHGMPHIFVIDRNLPDMSGDDFGRRLRLKSEVPIIMLTSHTCIDTKINAIEDFADDYVVKPHRERDLLGRIERILRRIPIFDYISKQVLHVDSAFKVHMDGRCVEVGGTEVNLTTIESRLLEIFLRNPNQVLTYDTLRRAVWQDEETGAQSLRVHVHRLRKKIQHKSCTKIRLNTARELGYQLVVPNPKAMSIDSGLGSTQHFMLQ
jgi:DNA-binding response OmpR family regulator